MKNKKNNNAKLSNNAKQMLWIIGHKKCPLIKDLL